MAAPNSPGQWEENLQWLVTTGGASDDANTANTFMGRLTKLRDLLLSDVNQDGLIVLASGVVTQNGTADFTNPYAKGIKLYIAPGSFGASESAMTVSIQGKDPISGNISTLLTSASLTANTFAVLTVYPGFAVAANVSANDLLPPTWRVAWNASNWGTGGSTLGIAAALMR